MQKRSPLKQFLKYLTILIYCLLYTISISYSNNAEKPFFLTYM